MSWKKCDNPDMLRDFWRELGGYKDDFEYLKNTHFITTVELDWIEKEVISVLVNNIVEYIDAIMKMVDKRYEEVLEEL